MAAGSPDESQSMAPPGVRRVDGPAVGRRADALCREGVIDSRLDSESGYPVTEEF